MEKNILIVEDEPVIRQELSVLLKNALYEVTVLDHFDKVAETVLQNYPDLVLLDLNLPLESGFDICTKIRAESDIPIIFLTGRTDSADELNGILRGGDDYITKPFKLAVFMSRINALLRRSDNFNQADTELNSNGIRVQLLKGEVYKNNVQVELTAREYKLLCLFMENPDEVLSPEQILNRLWDCDENYIDNNSLTVYIRRLRTKIEDDPGKPKRIVTVRRMGYKWNTAE